MNQPEELKPDYSIWISSKDVSLKDYVLLLNEIDPLKLQYDLAVLVQTEKISQEKYHDIKYMSNIINKWGSYSSESAFSWLEKSITNDYPKKLPPAFLKAAKKFLEKEQQILNANQISIIKHYSCPRLAKKLKISFESSHNNGKQVVTVPDSMGGAAPAGSDKQTGGKGINKGSETKTKYKFLTILGLFALYLIKNQKNKEKFSSKGKLNAKAISQKIIEIAEEEGCVLPDNIRRDISLAIKTFVEDGLKHIEESK